MFLFMCVLCHTGIPCGHAIACIWHKHDDPVDYVAECYKKETFLATYKYQIFPMNPIEQWPKTCKTPLSIPPDRAEPGRPKKLRRVEHDEVIPRGATKISRKYVTTTCSQCGKEGHNTLTCFRRKQEELVRFILLSV